MPQNRLEDARCVGALLCLWLVVTIVLLSVATLTIINTNLSAGQVKLLGKLSSFCYFLISAVPHKYHGIIQSERKVPKSPIMYPRLETLSWLAGWHGELCRPGEAE